MLIQIPTRKRTTLVVLPLAVALVAVSVCQWSRDGDTSTGTAAFGKPVKDFQLKDVITDRPKKLADYKRKVVVLAWYRRLCVASPFYDERLKKFAAGHNKDKKAALIVISSMPDTPESLREYAKQQEFNFPILRDDDSSLAKYFGIGKTCTFVVIDGEGMMRYRGGFDDNLDEKSVKHQYVNDAVQAIFDGKKIQQRETSSFG